MVAKERLVLNIINYIDELDTCFKTSSFSSLTFHIRGKIS